MKDPKAIFHRLVQRDMDGILRYYAEDASQSVADRFFETFIYTVQRATGNPRGYHFDTLDPRYRRAGIAGFPYHLLYREIPEGIRILVLRHDRRHPAFGLKRR